MREKLLKLLIVSVILLSTVYPLTNVNAAPILNGNDLSLKKSILAGNYQEMNMTIDPYASIKTVHLNYKLVDQNMHLQLDLNVASLYSDKATGIRRVFDLGNWELTSVLTVYRNGSYKINLDTSEGGSYDLSAGDFTVYAQDNQPPVLERIYTNTNMIIHNQMGEVFLEVSDELSEIEEVNVSVMYKGDSEAESGYFQLKANSLGGNLYKVDVPTFMSTKNHGIMEIAGVTIKDTSGNNAWYFDSQFPYGNFELSGGDLFYAPEFYAPRINISYINHKTVQSTEGNQLITVFDDESQVEAAEVVFLKPNGNLYTVQYTNRYGNVFDAFIPSEATANEGGTWQIYYIWAKDIYGNQDRIKNENYFNYGTDFTSSEFYVDYRDITPPSSPSVYEESYTYDYSTTLSGYTEPGALVTAEVNQQIIGQAKADTYGYYSISFTPQKGGTTISVHAADDSGNKSEGKPVYVIDNTAPEKVSVNVIGDSDLRLSGRAEANALIYAYLEDYTVSSHADDQGYFDFDIPKQRAGYTATFYAIDWYGNWSEPTYVTVTDNTAPTSPKVNTLTDQSTSVSGTAEPGATILIKNASKTLATGTSNAQGNYSIAVSKQVAGLNLMIYAVDQAGNTSVATTVKVQDVTSPAVTGVTNGYHKQAVTPIFTEGVASLNGTPFFSGQSIRDEGNYELSVVDTAGNKTVYQFIIDYTPVKVANVTTGTVYKATVAPTFVEGDATLNGHPYFSGEVIAQEGKHQLLVWDSAGNETKIDFEIDLTAPTVTGVDLKLYNKSVKPVFTDTGTLNGKSFVSGTVISAAGDYQLVVQDKAGNQVIKEFSIDLSAPIVSGVRDNAGYKESVTVLFNEGTASLNGKTITNGTVVKNEGEYVLTVTDKAGNSTTLRFVIDFTPPTVEGVSHEHYYNQPVIPSFKEGTATLNGQSYTSGMKIDKEGEYELIVKDQVGNQTIVKFGLDFVAPTLNVENMSYNKPIKPIFTEGIAILNGQPFTSGTTISLDGSYELTVKDKAGNATTARFKLDQKPVIVTGIEEGKTYQQAKPIFTEGTAKLNGVAYTSGALIALEGDHVLIVTDEAGNETKISFSIDHTAPVIRGFLEGKTSYREVTPTFTEGVAMLNGKPFVTGTKIATDGDYELKVTDKGGNETTVRFRIDQKPVIVTGVESGKTYQQVKPIFTEGVGKLNGASYVSGTTIDQTGDYVLIVTDDAGNETKLSFSIDRTSPVISGLVDGKQSYREVTPLFNEGTASLNGKAFVSGTKLVQEGKYVLKVTDQIGNVTTREFTIDRTTPIVTGVKSKQLTNKSVIVYFNEGSATLNGKNIASGQTVVASGSYTLKVTDEAGNVTLLTFTIDKVAPSKPSISTLTNKSTKVTGKAEKGSTVSITYNGRTYTTKASTAGTYSYNLKTTKAGATVTVRAKDAAGNLSTAVSSKVLNTFATFTVNTVKSSAISLTGKGNKAATVQAFVGTKAISKTAKVDSKGNYKLTIPRQKAGVTVTVKMKQAGYLELKKATKVVK